MFPRLKTGRDLIKACRFMFWQVINRLVLVKREQGTSISFCARLDIHPKFKDQKPFSLLMKNGAVIESQCVVNTWHGEVVLGEGSSLGIGTVVIGPICIGKSCAISQNCFVSGESHKYEDVSRNWREQGFTVKPVIIEDDVWVGANVVILPGVTIGCHSVVGAGSVVTKDIPPYSVVVGNPGKVVKQCDNKSGEWVRL